MVTTKPRADAIHALAVYAESLADARRVIVFGVAVGLGQRLVDFGAQTVVEVAPGDDVSPLRRGAFDLALVTEPASFGDPAELLALVRRLVADDGVAVVSAGDALDYYQLFDLVAAEFEDVRMVAQLPFRGVALVELGGEDSPAVSVDTQLAAADRAPETFVAVASRYGAKLDPYAIVELPPRAEEPGDRVASEAVYAALAQERLRADALEAQLEELRRRAVASGEIQAALALQVRRVAELQAALEEERSEAEQGRMAAVQLEDAELRVEEARRVAATTEAELTRVAHAHGLELARFEEALRERARTIRALEAEVARRDVMVHELVDSLDALPAKPPSPTPSSNISSDPTALTDELARENSILRWRLDVLAMDLARSDAEAQAGEWAIQELEHELAREADARALPSDEGPSMPAAPAPEAGDAERRLAAAIDELDALRIALTQEHKARILAESGEELARARAEIQRQAALLEQLARELEVARAPREELR